MQFSRDRLTRARAQFKIKQAIFVAVFVVAAIWLICTVDPLYDYPHDSLVAPAIGTKQTCAVGIWNERTHMLEVNPSCPASPQLLRMERPPTDKKLTYMLLYYNNHKHLAHQVYSWKSFSKAALDQTQFVIIDDGSTLGHTAADLFAANREYMKGLDVLVYKIDQDLAWNIGGARNLGFFMANTKWVFMNDADIEVKPDTMDFVIDLVNEENAPPPSPTADKNGTATTTKSNLEKVYLYFKRWREAGFKNHPAVMLIKREHFWMLGGCDEDFVGNYGQTDPHFRLKIKLDPTLHGTTTEDLMNERKISPLYEMGDSIPCPAGMTCLEPYIGQTPSRDTKTNKELIKEKRKIGKWSNELLRFTWKRATWEPTSWFSWFQ